MKLIDIGMGEKDKNAMIDWMYPNIYPQKQPLDSLIVSLCHVRAANNIKICFDGDRNAWIILMDKTKDVEQGSEIVEEACEVAVIPAWYEDGDCEPIGHRVEGSTKEQLRRDFDIAMPLVGTDERDYCGQITRDDVSDWWLEKLDLALQEERERLAGEMETLQQRIAGGRPKWKMHDWEKVEINLLQDIIHIIQSSK